MKAPNFQRQETFFVKDLKIKIIIRRKTRQANLLGWNIHIIDSQKNELKIDIFVLKFQKAREIAYVKFIKKFH